MAEKQTVAISITTDTSEAQSSVKSFKAQLREANGELIAMSEKFGAASAEATAAAKKVAGLKDAIGDAKALAETFNPDKKFVALGGAIQGAVSGFSALQGIQGLFGAESKELEQTLLKVQSAMALQQGISGVFNAIDSFKLLKIGAVDTFKAIRTAITSTGIGALVVALGLIVAYWDDIKQAVFGTSEKQKELNKLVEDNLKKEKDKLSAINEQDNILKLQGKSEKDILKIKIAQTDATIKAAEVSLQNLKAQKVIQVQLAERNQKILEGLLNFLSIPITTILYAVDKIRSTLGQTSTLLKDYKQGLSSLVFDPKAVAKESDDSIKEAEKGLTNLKNQRAGFQLQLQAIDKKASDDAANKAKEANQKKLQDEEAYQKLKAEFIGKADLAIQKTEFDRQRIQVQMNAEAKKREIEKIQDVKKRNELIVLLEKETANELQKIAKEEAEKNKEIQAKRFSDLNKKVDDNLAINKKRLDDSKKEQEAQQALAIELTEKGKTKDQQELDALEAQYQKKRDLAKGNATLLLMVEEDYQKAKEQLQFVQKERELSMYGELAGRFADIVGRQTTAGKALAIAQATIDTYGAANKVLNSNSPAFIANPTLRFLSAAATIVTGLMNIKKIVSVQVPGGGGGGGAAVPSAPSAPMLPQASSTMINQGQINQIGNVAARAFVVESDVSGNQERIQRLNRAARIS